MNDMCPCQILFYKQTLKTRIYIFVMVYDPFWQIIEAIKMKKAELQS